VKILSIDGASGALSCAVRSADTVQAHTRIAAGETLESGLDAIRQTLDRAGTPGRALDLIVVCTGPGSFTSLRIAISYAKSLAQGWKKPLVGYNTFDVLELGCSIVPRLAVICAREGIISARLTLAGEQLRESGPTAAVCEWATEHAPQPELTVSGGPKDVLAALGERGKFVHILEPPPPALALAALAQTRVDAGSPHEIRPDYGELPPAVRPTSSGQA